MFLGRYPENMAKKMVLTFTHLRFRVLKISHWIGILCLPHLLGENEGWTADLQADSWRPSSNQWGNSNENVVLVIDNMVFIHV